MAVWLVMLLCVEYVIIAIVSALERRWPWVLYFVGATAISLSLLWMRER